MQHGASYYGVAVDMWSTGCILAELLAGKPIMPGRTEVEQLHKIFKLCGSPSEEFWRTSKLPHATSFKPQQCYQRCVAETFKDFPASALALLDCLLAIEPAERGTAASALKSEFFMTKPFACDPSSLPKYPPSKEYDAKLRDEEARRQRAAAVKVHESDLGRKKELPAPNGNLGSKLQGNPKSSTLSYNSKEDATFGYPSNGHSGRAENGVSHHVLSMHSGRLSAFEILNGQEIKPQKSSMPQGRDAELPNISGPVVARSNTARLDHRQTDKHLQLPRQHSDYHLDVDDASEKQEWTHHLLHGPPSSHKKHEKTGGKEQTAGYGTKKSSIHYSGPLMPPGVNIEEMLKEHERQIQQAVRRARLDKIKAKNYGEKGLSEALLYPSRN